MATKFALAADSIEQFESLATMLSMELWQTKIVRNSKPIINIAVIQSNMNMKPDSMIDLKYYKNHDYGVTIKSRGKSRGVSIEVRSAGNLIGTHNATEVPVLWAIVAKGDQARYLADQISLLACRAESANHANQVDRRDPRVMANLSYGDERDELLARDIQRGVYARMAQKHIEEAELHMAKVKGLLAGPLPEFERLRVLSWHRSRSPLRHYSKDPNVVDILEIRTWLVHSGTSRRKFVFQPPSSAGQEQPAKLTPLVAGVAESQNEFNNEQQHI